MFGQAYHVCVYIYLYTLCLSIIHACNYKPQFYNDGMLNNLGYHNLHLGIYIMPNSIYLYHCMLVYHIPIYSYQCMYGNHLLGFASFKPSYITSHPLSCHAYVNSSTFLPNSCSTIISPRST